jgi:hypothetical protein
MGKIGKEEWVWILVQDPGANEQFLGQLDEENRLTFIPAFLTKEEAQNGLEKMARESGHTYEAQAIRMDDLSRRAAENGFVVFVLNASGQIVETVKPEASA